MGDLVAFPAGIRPRSAPLRACGEAVAHRHALPMSRDPILKVVADLMECVGKPVAKQRAELTRVCAALMDIAIR